MNSKKIDEASMLWNLVLTARFDITRALALTKLSTIDPERFKKVLDIVHSKKASDARTD